jgi:putative membrane protein
MVRRVCSMGILAFLAAACSQQVEEARDPGDTASFDGVAAGAQPSPQPAQSVDQPNQQPLATTTMVAAPTSAPVETALTDGQIVGVLDAANDKEIEESKIALTRSKNAEVKAFAKMMVDHHTEAKKKGAKLAASAPPAESEVSKKLKADTATALEALKATADADFDRAYLDMMVADHKAVLDLVDSKILPVAKTAELKTLVEKDVRPTVDGHLTKATALHGKVAAKAAAAAPSAKPGAATPATQSKPSSTPPAGDKSQPSAAIQ